MFVLVEEGDQRVQGVELRREESRRALRDRVRSAQLPVLLLQLSDPGDPGSSANPGFSFNASTIRTARSRRSSLYFLGADMTPASVKRSGPSTKPGAVHGASVGDALVKVTVLVPAT
jgi:hypothetical protein